MPTTKITGNTSRENDSSKKMGSQPSSSSSSNSDRNKENRTNTVKQGNQMPKTHK